MFEFVFEPIFELEPPLPEPPFEPIFEFIIGVDEGDAIGIELVFIIDELLFIREFALELFELRLASAPQPAIATPNASVIHVPISLLILFSSLFYLSFVSDDSEIFNSTLIR